MVLRSILEASAPEGTARRRWIRLVRRAMWSYRARGLWQTLAVVRMYLRPQSLDPLYDRWIREREPSPADLDAQRAWAHTAGHRPTISVLLAVPEELAPLLRETVASVCAQTYPRWELCLAHRPAATPTVQGVLERLALADSRVRQAVVGREAARGGGPPVPKVLCHRRPTAPPTQPAPHNPQTALHRRALTEHLGRRGLAANVETQPNGTQRAVWPVVDPPLVSIIIPTRDQPELVKQCVDGLLRRTSHPRKAIVLVDTFRPAPTVHDSQDG